MTRLYIRAGSRYVRATDAEVIRAVLICATLRGKVTAALLRMMERMGRGATRGTGIATRASATTPNTSTTMGTACTTAAARSRRRHGLRRRR